MDGLLIEALAAEHRRDIDREMAKPHLTRRGRRIRRPAGSWVLAGSTATWLR